MKFANGLPSLVVMLGLLSVSPLAKAQAGDASPVQLLPVTPEMEAITAKDMQDCPPLAGKSVGAINKNGVYTLTGDLFHNGQIYALIDDNQDVILCEWQKSVWKPVSAISVETDWNFPSGYREQVGRSPDNQPQPFWILNLQDRPLLGIASSVEKAGQYYYLILFDSKCEQILSTDSSFGLRPEVKDQYLLTGDSSRGKAEWEATYYSKVQNNAFVLMKSWEDSQPWHAEDRDDQPDDSSNYASSGGKGYIIVPDNSNNKPPADYIIYASDTAKKGATSYNTRVTSFAAIYSTPDKNSNGDEIIVYLFEKLTGLPRELFPGYDDASEKGKSQPHFKITGTDQTLVKLLSP